MENMSAVDFPCITTRQKRTEQDGFTDDGEKLDLIIADNKRQARYDKGTGVRIEGDSFSFYERGEKQEVHTKSLLSPGYPVSAKRFQGLLRFGNNVIAYPGAAVVNKDISSSEEYRLIGISSGGCRVPYKKPNSNVTIERSTEGYLEFLISKIFGTEEGIYSVTMRCYDSGHMVLRYDELIRGGLYQEILTPGARIRLEQFEETDGAIQRLGDFGAAFFVVTEVPTMTVGAEEIHMPYWGRTLYTEIVFKVKAYSYDGLPKTDIEDYSNPFFCDLNPSGVYLYMLDADANLLAVYQNRLWGTDTLGTSLYCSNATDFYDWKIDGTAAGGGYLDVAENSPWTAICEYGGYLYAFKQNKLYKVLGSNALDYRIVSICDFGCIDSRAVAVCDSVLYFLGRDGVYGFTGNIPVRVSYKLDREYQSGVLEGRGSLLFASLLTTDGEKEFFVYDTSRQIWNKEDDFSVRCFVDYADGVYALGEDNVCYRLCDGKADGSIPFSFTTKQYFYYFDQKAVSSVNLFLDMDEGASVTVSVSYDNQDFAVCGTFSGSRLKYIPVRLRKCDEFRIRVSGHGFIRLKQLEFILRSGGRNHRS